MVRILVVEDEEAIARGLKFNFEHEGYDVTLTGDGRTALAEFESAAPAFDLVVLDLMLPEMSGYDVCREIRRRNEQIPILMLTARTLSEDKVQGFEAGTDQYLTKPFSLAELLARVRNLLTRRAGNGARGSSAELRTVFRFNGIEIDFPQFTVRVDHGTETVHELTTLEAQLLRYFVEHEGTVLPRQDILDNVWPADAEVTQRTIDNFVLRLRRIIEPDPANPRYLLSVRGTGYRFVANPA